MAIAEAVVVVIFVLLAVEMTAALQSLTYQIAFGDGTINI